MKNIFFDRALKTAGGLSGSKARIMRLLVSLGSKMRIVNWKNVNLSNAKDKLSVLSRIVEAYATGSYRALSHKTVVIMLAAILYFLNPFDLIPDFVPGLGLTDDFSILVWVYSSLYLDIESFLVWEKTTLPNG